MDGQYYRKAKSKLRIPPSVRKVAGNRAILITLLLAVPALSFIMFSNRGIVKRMSLVAEKEAMQQKVQEAQAEQVRLARLSKDLDKDPRAIEKVAREKYGMVREGETVYKVKKEK
jgi:cell division protein FtsB